ncbi:class I SAM-dependent methyltransferase [Bosea sp. TWI1241]|uniref:class I SAM-dependent methyltransferase n=1 Tax=Bosea sp. TWI1241 TaxID=3148904 RepID=UPI00320B43A2
MTIPTAVLQVLDAALVAGSTVRLTGTLDRALYTKVDKVLQAAGGKWSRKERAHVFLGDAAGALEQIILTGGGSKKQELGQFDSPAEVVAAVMELAGIDQPMQVLEPSAGRGALALAAARLTDHVLCVEIDPARCASLVKAGLRSVIEADFLSLDGLGLFDRVVMNPPFAGQADIDHVLRAAKRVRPGGRLVSVMSAGTGFRQNRKAVAFREWIARRGGRCAPLPSDAFRASGTSVQTCIVSVDIGMDGAE